MTATNSYPNPHPTSLPSNIHQLSGQLTQNVHAYLDKSWSFSSNAYKTAFFSMDFPRLLALICPEGEIERLETAALFVCLTGLLDDAFSQMSLSDSQEIGKRLLGIMQGSTTADSSNPIEKILRTIIDDMRTRNAELARDVMKGAIALIHAQTDKARLRIKDLEEFFTTITRFVHNISITPSSLERFSPLETAVIRHVILTNDIISWDKEIKEAHESNQEGAALCSAIPILARNLRIGFEGAKRVLWVAVRELEGEIGRLAVGLRVGFTQEERDGEGEGERYIRVLEYLASGNEEWSRTTSRYRVE
ncbi:hypothetical protein BDV12DRAFT_205551 [Aspergillus spectabilis]